MTHDVVVSAFADADIEAALKRMLLIAKIEATVAFDWAGRLRVSFQSLSSFPERFAISDEPRFQDRKIREYVFGKRRGAWRVLYTVEPGRVSIVRVLRGSRGPLGPNDLG